MKRRNLLQTIYPFLVLVTLPPVILLFILSAGTVKDIVHDQTYRTIKESAYLIRNIIPEYRIEDTAFITQFCKNAIKGTDFRITVMLPDGVVTGDSHMDPVFLENHLFREEMQEAIYGKEGFAERYSNSLGIGMFYFALPIGNIENISGVIRTSIPIDAVNSILLDSYKKTLVVTLLIIAGILLLSCYIAKLISRPIITLADMTIKFSTLNFNAISVVEGPEEIHALSVNLKKMSTILEQRFNLAIHQRKELKAILSALVEAIIVTDKDLIIKEVNRSAVKLFKIDDISINKDSLVQVTRNSELNELAEITILEKTPQKRTILLKEQINEPSDGFDNQKFTSRDLFLHVNTAIIETEDHDPRIILVLHDITQIKTLERIRSDFVANVSHELKTPITSILGFTETLKSGAINNKKDTIEFLDIIQSQSHRLDAIIKDLLSLSKLESFENTKIDMEYCKLKEIVSSALKICRIRIKEKNTDIQILFPKNLIIRANSALFEQALVNLIDNAVKYCPPKSTITVFGESFPDYTLIKITDNGPGIPEKDIPRVFERFYTVNKTRSHELGGTGLGLAIVKHIILAHKGEINLNSSAGKGTEFIIRIPS